MTHEITRFAVPAALMGIVAMILALVSLAGLDQGVGQVAFLIVGVLIMSALATFKQSVLAGRREPARISFDTPGVRRLVDAAMPAERRTGDRTVVRSSDELEPTPEDLLGEDPALALAKLRIDIERELRRIERKRGRRDRQTRISDRLRRLQRLGILDPKLAAAVRDILPACNEAIHGGMIDEQTARAILEIGEDVVALLAAVHVEGAVEAAPT